MIERSNPPELHAPPGYHHVTVVQPGMTVHLAGQCPLDDEGNLVGGDDVAQQASQVATNIVTALASVGATPADVVRATIYVASSSRADLVTVWQTLRESAAADAIGGASTLLGVAQLGFPGQLVEVDITAALPAPATG